MRTTSRVVPNAAYDEIAAWRLLRWRRSLRHDRMMYNPTPIQIELSATLNAGQ